MLKRYVAIYGFLHELELTKIGNLLLEEDDNEVVLSTSVCLGELESITKKLQDPSVTLRDTCVLVDGVLAKTKV